MKTCSCMATTWIGADVLEGGMAGGFLSRRARQFMTEAKSRPRIRFALRSRNRSRFCIIGANITASGA